jgi:hypothetical protein
MLTLALTLALAIPQGTTNTPPGAPQRGLPAVSVRPLETAAQVRALCDALTPVERLRARGDAVEQARAEADHQARRDAAVGARYHVTIGGDRLRFDQYEAEDQRLTLSDRTYLTGASGALHVWAAEDADLPVTVDARTAERIVKAAQKKTLALALTFALPEDDDEVICSHPAGAQLYTLGIEPLTWEYVDQGRVLARGGEGGDRPLVTAAEGARPRVEVAEPIGDGGPRVKSAVAARSRDLEACYARALQANPGLDGSLVADVDLSSGTPTVRVAVDSLQDEVMLNCVRGVLARVEFPRDDVERTAVPIHFVLEPPLAQGGTGVGQ